MSVRSWSIHLLRDWPGRRFYSRALLEKFPYIYGKVPAAFLPEPFHPSSVNIRTNFISKSSVNVRNCIKGSGQKRCRNSFGRFRLLTEIPCTSSVYVSCIFTERSVNYRKVGYGNSPLINGCSVIIRKFSLSTRGKWSVNVRKYIKKFRQKRCRNSFTCFRLLTHARKSNVCTFLHVSNIKRTLIVTVSRY